MSTLSQFAGGAAGAKWVSGTTYPLDSIVWSPTNYLSYVRIVAGGGTTDPSADATNWALIGPSKIKSIQRGTISITSSSSSATATISAVNTAKTELRHLGGTQVASSSEVVNPSAFGPRISLTNSTTVTATRPQASSATFNSTVSYEVVEWW
jgi:hypothetical protein